MGISDDAVKGNTNTPDLTPVKGMYRRSCDHASSAITKVKDSLSDEEIQSRIKQFATTAATLAFHEGLKFFPGVGYAYSIISRSLQDAKKLEVHKKKIKDHENETKEPRAIVERPEKDISSNKKLDMQRGRVVLQSKM